MGGGTYICPLVHCKTATPLTSSAKQHVLPSFPSTFSSKCPIRAETFRTKHAWSVFASKLDRLARSVMAVGVCAPWAKDRPVSDGSGNVR